MAHWAELDDNNIVVRVTVGDNDDPNGDEGYQWLLDNIGGRWVKTSYNNNIRKQYAGVGFTYDEVNDVFISPSPFPSWVLNDDFDWEAPIPKPEDGLWLWDEQNLSWIKQTPPKPFESWIFKGEKWIAPIPYPNNRGDKIYIWNEENQSWDETHHATPVSYGSFPTTPYPVDDDKIYIWNEENQSWVEI